VAPRRCDPEESAGTPADHGGATGAAP
jgi:hypothetical protein